MTEKITQKQEPERLREKVALYEEILDHVLQGVYVVDCDEKIVWLNRIIEEQDGVSRDLVIGESDVSIWKTVNRGSPDAYRATRAKGEPKEWLVNYMNEFTGQMTHMFSRTYPFYYHGELRYIYSLGYYLEYAEKQLNHIAEYRIQLTKEKHHLRNGTANTFYDIIGSSHVMRNLVDVARKVALNPSSVMLCGATGTGKEIFAQGIHNAGPDHDKQFVAVNCAAIPDNLLESLLFGTVKGAFTGAADKAGLLEEANGGTLFLDELDSMPIHIQGKLLRVLQENQASRIGSNKTYAFRCRFISAVHEGPWELVKSGVLRSDLYYRLAVVTLEIPRLAERGNDLEELIQHFLFQYNQRYNLKVTGVSDEVMDFFRSYPWPGNVRELQHVIEHMMNFVPASKNILSFTELPSFMKEYVSLQKPTEEDFFNQKKPLHDILSYTEKKYIENALERNHWHITNTAKELGIHREALHYRIKKLEIRRK